MNQFIKDILNSLESFQDPKRIAFANRTYPTKMSVMGVTNPQVKLVLHEVKPILKEWSDREKINWAIELVKTDVFECQYMAYEYLGKQKKLLKALTLSDLEALDRNMDNWVSVDTFAVHILGVAWRLGTVSDNQIATLLHSKDVWERRKAVVATVSLNLKSRGGMGDVKRTLNICKHVVNDHEAMIVKALSWSLRELSKTDEDAVIDFLNRHENELHKRVLREVNTKLTTGVKTMRR